MAIIRNISMVFSFFFCFFLKSNLTFGSDSIYVNQSLSGAQTIISASGNFKLGFFDPGKSVSKNSRYYLGIWYNKLIEGDTEISVWVANREKPISDKDSAILKILDGNLVLLNEFKEPIWSTNIEINSSHSSNDLVAVLRDDGNLVVTDVTNLNTSAPLWQSFDHPGNTWLTGGKISFNKQLNTSYMLTSWKNDFDPAQGLYSLELDLNGSGLIMKWNRSQQYNTSGTWNGSTFSFVDTDNYLYNFSYVNNKNVAYFTYNLYNPSSISRFVMDPNGQLKEFIWMKASKEWNLVSATPPSLCEIYAYCGAFGICNSNSFPSCSCPEGFDSYKTHDVVVPSGGCLRNKPLQCGSSKSSNGESDRFKEISNIFLTDQLPNSSVVSILECESTCLSNCFCTAYSYDNGYCSIWTTELLNMQRTDTGRTIYIRLAESEFTSHNNRKEITIIGAVLGSVVIFLGISLVVFCRRRKKLIEKTKELQDLIVASPYKERQIASIKMLDKLRCGVLGPGFKMKLPQFQGELSDIPIFSFENIQAATDKFSAANRLGEGGFGPVFKGQLPNGQQIAVKRLSKGSGQGIEEFKNEVTLISKVQHRNLVKLLGFCIHGEERMLVYEYMQNKSLDLFIFGSTRKTVLDWGLRNNIIEKIARGLLYLHQDSRLKIIHRDLKASNILLDEHMIPRISDFGMARIVMINQSVVNTNRVVGTYGYMPPEYALHGIFSVKSDVFSFGVLLLEIVSGQRISDFGDNDNPLNLLAYAWQLWNEEKALELLDPNLANLCNTAQVCRCIHVALLCVQENLNDRPTMSDVVSMLCNDTDLATPKQPAFFYTRMLDASSSRLRHETFVDSRNEISISIVRGR